MVLTIGVNHALKVWKVRNIRGAQFGYTMPSLSRHYLIPHLVAT
jgi:hypothetical protein